MKQRNKKSPVGLWRADRAGENGLSATAFTLKMYDTTVNPRNQDLSNLIDLATAEYEAELEQAVKFQALADHHRRRAWRAMDNLRAYQAMIPGGQAQ